MKEPDCVSVDAVRAVTAYVTRLAEEGAKGTAEGRVDALPLKDVCDRCDYRDICVWKGSRCLSASGRIMVKDFASGGAPRSKLNYAADEEDV